MPHVAHRRAAISIAGVTRASGPYPFEPYAPSGHLGRAWALPFIGVVSAAAGGFAYGWLLAATLCIGHSKGLFVLWFLMRIVMALAFAYSIALPVSFAGLLLKVRSPMALRLYGAWAALVGLWFAWVVYLWAMQRNLAPA